jgi:hypothetical protein
LPNDARIARIASRAFGPRPAKSRPSIANSSASEPTPTPRIRRPRLTTSSVP